jgi:hypothetical protein
MLHAQRNVRGRASERDLAAEGVLLRWKKERVIFLQDAAVLWDKFSDLIMYQDPVFKHPKWEPFRQEVLEMCERYKDIDVEGVDNANLPAEVRSLALMSLDFFEFLFVNFAVVALAQSDASFSVHVLF